MLQYQRPQFELIKEMPRWEIGGGGESSIVVDEEN